MTEPLTKMRPPTATERLDDQITELSAKTRLKSWNEFVEALAVPQDLLPGMLTNRPELLKLAQPRAMTEAEVAVLYKLIIGLIETNQALREHAEQVAHQVTLWEASFKQLESVGRRIKAFANFKRTDNLEDEDE